MALYEHVFLARQDLAQAQVDALAEAATKIVEDNEGKVVKTETWGLRSLAYRIAKNRKAHYVMLYMTVKVDELEQGPSVMMRKGDRERGRGRRDRDEAGGNTGFGGE